MITADDMRVSDLEAMPNVRSLLQQRGTTFARSYASFPLCCPSRASFLTGQYAHNHGVLDNDPPLGGYAAFDPSSTAATWLDDAGYQTAFVGKFLNEYGSVRPIVKSRRAGTTGTPPSTGVTTSTARCSRTARRTGTTAPTRRTCTPTSRPR